MVKPIPQNKLIYGRQLRNNPTPWEFKLWQYLKDDSLGVRFRRQVYIGGFLVDLCCSSKKLIIEIDGSYHKLDPLKEKRRLEFLKREGYKVLKFWNSEVDNNIDKVLEKIIQTIN